MDALYALMVRLSMDVQGVGAAATAAMRAFSQVEAGATRVDRLMAGTRLTMDTRGLSAGANEAMAAFRQLEMQGGRMGTVFGGMNLSRGTQPLIDSVTQAQTRLAGFEQQAAAAEARVSSLDKTMARATFLNGGTPPLQSRSYQWSGMERMQAGQAALSFQGQAGTATADLQAAQGALQSHLSTQMAGVEAAMAAEQARMNKSMGMLAGGAALTAGGIGVLSFFDAATKKAMQYQTAMLTVEQATGATRDTTGQLSQKLNTLATSVGLNNQMSSLQVAQLMGAEVAAGATLAGKTPAQRVQALQTITPSMGNLAEVLYQTRGMDRSQTATTAVEFAHIFGQLTPKGVASMTNLLGRALYITPGTPEELKTLTSQFAGTLRPLYGNSPADQQRFMTDAIQTAALESVLGQQTRGGTQLASMFVRTLGGGAARVSKQGMAALGALEQQGGGSFFDAQGKMAGTGNALAIVARAAAAPNITPEQFGRELQLAFGRAGGLQAGLLSQPSTLTAFQNLGQQLGPQGLPSMQVIRDAYNATPAGQFEQAQQNWQSFEIAMGTQLLPAATKLAEALASVTRTMVQFAGQHPTLTRMAVTFAAIAGAAALVAGPIMVAVGAVGLLAPAFGTAGVAAGGSAIALTGIGAAAAALVPPLAIAAASVLALTWVFLHWDNITTNLGNIIGWFSGLLKTATANIDTFITAAKKIPVVGGLASGANPLNAIPGVNAVNWALQSGVASPDLLVKSAPGIGPVLAGLDWLGSDHSSKGRNAPHATPAAAMPVVGAKAGGGSGLTVNIHPGAIQPHIHTGPVKDQKKLARDLSVYVLSGIGKSIQDQTQHGAIGGAPLVPRATW